MASVMNTGKKVSFISQLADVLLDTAKNTDAAMIELLDVNATAKRHVMSLLTNSCINVTGLDEECFFGLLRKTVDVATQMASTIRRSGSVAPEQQRSLNAATQSLDDVLPLLKKSYTPVPLADDSEDNWTESVQLKAVEAVKHLTDARLMYITEYHDAYVKNCTEIDDETKQILARLGKSQEQFCNSVAMAFNKVLKEFETDGSCIAGMMDALNDSASIKMPEIDTNEATRTMEDFRNAAY